MTNSVALATYNGSKYILDLLNSIRCQTKQVDQVVIVDDCSTDDTVEKIQAFIDFNNLQKVFKVYVNEKNLGYAENFRKAIELTDKEVIYLADQDDVWVDTRVEKMSKVMEQNDNIGLLNTDYACFTDDINSLSDYYEENAVTVKKLPLNYKNRFLKFPGCVMAIRKEFYKEIKEYWYKGWAHDEFLWCTAVLFDRCYYYKYCSLKRRVHSEQTSGRVGKSLENRIKYLNSEIMTATKLLEIAKTKGFNEKTIRLYTQNKITTEYRLQLIKNKKILKIFPLLFRLKYYNSKRAYLRELIIGIKK